MQCKVLTRLKDITRLQTQLEKCLAGAMEYLSYDSHSMKSSKHIEPACFVPNCMVWLCKLSLHFHLLPIIVHLFTCAEIM